MALDEAKVKAKIKSIIEVYARTKVEHIQAWEDSFGNWVVRAEVEPQESRMLAKIAQIVQLGIGDTFAELKLKRIDTVLLPEIPRADQRFTGARLDILLNPRAPGELSATEEESIVRMCHMLAAMDKANRRNQKEEPTMKLIDMVKLTSEDEKITLILKGEEVCDTEPLTPYLLAVYGCHPVEKVTVDEDYLVITIPKSMSIEDALQLAKLNKYGCGCT